MSIIQIIAPTSSASGPFLDAYATGVFSVYGLNLLLSAYGTGPAINVRRSSDNTTQDIHFLSTGALDTVSLLAFCGSGNGFVTIWYDQTGNGNHIANSTTTLQPQVVNAGVYSGFIVFDGVDDALVCVNTNGSPAACSVYWGGTLRSTARQIIACSDNTDSGGPTSTSGVMTVAYENTFNGTQNKLFTSNYSNGVSNEATGVTITNNVLTYCTNFFGSTNATRNNIYSAGTLVSPSYSNAGTIPTSTTLFASNWTVGCATEASILRPAAISLKNFVIYNVYHSSTDVTNVETVLHHYV